MESQLSDKEQYLNAKNYAYRILGQRMYSCKEIRDKLNARSYTDEIIQEVIENLKGYGYLNDKTYAQEWIQSRMRSNPKGKNVLRQELIRKGIEPSIIDEVLSQELDGASEEDAALELARRKFRLYKNDKSADTIRKLQGILFRRGFNSEIVRKVIKQVMDENKFLEDN